MKSAMRASRTNAHLPLPEAYPSTLPECLIIDLAYTDEYPHIMLYHFAFPFISLGMLPIVLNKDAIRRIRG